MKLLQFPTCWPMNGLFVHWSRGWGVLSFSERLVSVFFRIASLVQGQFIDNILEKDLVVKKLKCIASNLCFVSLWPNDSSVSQLNYFWSNLAERYLYFLLLLSNNKKMKIPICWFKNECSPNCAFIIYYVLVLYLSMLLNNYMNIPFLWFKNDSIFKTVHLFYE